MVKRRTVAFGGAGFLLVAGIIVVIVLAALGYFKPKSGGSNCSKGTLHIQPKQGYYYTDGVSWSNLIFTFDSSCATPTYSNVKVQFVDDSTGAVIPLNIISIYNHALGTPNTYEMSVTGTLSGPALNPGEHHGTLYISVSTGTGYIDGSVTSSYQVPS